MKAARDDRELICVWFAPSIDEGGHVERNSALVTLPDFPAPLARAPPDAKSPACGLWPMMRPGA
eukprot:1577056-Prymnesium_polylepis.1